MNCLRGFNALSCLRDLLPKPFPWFGIAARQWRFEIRAFLLLDKLFSQANEPPSTQKY